MNEELIEKVVKKSRIYKGKIIELFCDEVELPDGSAASREYLVHPGAAAVLPFIDKEKIILVKQFRYPVSQITYEIPAGKIDNGETPLHCAMRELEEETGYKADDFKSLLSFYPAAALSTEFLHIFSAFGIEKGSLNPDEDEFIDTEVVNFRDVLAMVKDGRIKDSKTIIAVLYFDSLMRQ